MRRIERAAVAAALLSLSLTPAAAGQSAGAGATNADAVDGRIVCGSELRAEVLSGGDAFIESEGDEGTGIGRGQSNLTPALEMSDERLDGRWTRSSDWSLWDGGEYLEIITWQVENDAGSWLGQQWFASHAESDELIGLAELSGSGGYDGLTAILHIAGGDGCGWDIAGIVVDGPLPDAPTPPTE